MIIEQHLPRGETVAQTDKALGHRWVDRLLLLDELGGFILLGNGERALVEEYNYRQHDHENKDHHREQAERADEVDLEALLRCRARMRDERGWNSRRKSHFV